MCVPGLGSRVKTEGTSEAEEAFSAIVEPLPEIVRDASLEAGDGAAFVPELEKQEDLRTRALT